MNRHLLAVTTLLLVSTLSSIGEPSETQIRQISESLASGISLYEAGDFVRALAQFDAILEIDPAHARARLERARSLLRLQQYDAAKREFKYVLDRHNPPPKVRRNIETYLTMLAREDRRFFLDGSLTIGAFYDSNVNYGPDSRFIEVDPIDFGFASIDQFEVSPDSQPQSSAGAVVSAGVVGRYDFGNRSAWSGLTGVNYYRTFLDKHTDFENQFAGAQAGVRHDSTSGIVEIPLRYQNLQRGGEDIVDILGIAPTWAFTQGRSAMNQAYMQAEERDFVEADDEDSVYLEGGFNHVRRVGSSVSTYLALKGGLFNEEAETDPFSNRGLRLGGGYRQMIATKTGLHLSGDYRYKLYDGEDAFTGIERDDHEFIGSVNVSQELTKDLTAAILYQYTRNISSVDLYDYDRSLPMLTVTATF